MLIFWVESSIDTSSCAQDTLDRVGPLGAVISRSGLCASVWGVKQVEKKWLRRFTFSVGVVAVMD